VGLDCVYQALLVRHPLTLHMGLDCVYQALLLRHALTLHSEGVDLGLERLLHGVNHLRTHPWGHVQDDARNMNDYKRSKVC